MLDLDRDIVVMFDDAHKAEAEHLPVNVLAILGNDSLPRQHLLADFMVALAGLARHPARRGPVFVEIIAVCWHISGEYAGKHAYRQGREHDRA